MQELYRNITHIRLERFFAGVELCVFCLALFAYIYCIVMSVVHVVLRQEYLVAIQDTEARVSKLESEYLARVGELTPERAKDLGFSTLTTRAYVEVPSGTSRLTRRE